MIHRSVSFLFAMLVLGMMFSGVFAQASAPPASAPTLNSTDSSVNAAVNASIVSAGDSIAILNDQIHNQDMALEQCRKAKGIGTTKYYYILVHLNRGYAALCHLFAMQSSTVQGRSMYNTMSWNYRQSAFLAEAKYYQSLPALVYYVDHGGAGKLSH